MFVVGAALFYTGLAQKIGETVVSRAGTNENSLMLAIMVITAIMSAFLSNTGTTAALLPVVVGICAVAKIPASRQLMPMAFAAGVGGINTMVEMCIRDRVFVKLQNKSLKQLFLKTLM